ncbi:hypothetical protein Pst134EA_011245 [Puccinia striiformis f. sp. tritici]|uniref:hypothetical protein n=1 Tax=Puccinia striiformis f. sp. tritici TaxID=168172 RepID=UPI0020073B3A|nr:hypothetical protein Pst134EA_011245 [Puccinia striiformis f. sp. tritici]KAH9467606.1 hypothetical protein Pst134EA_011245 [Puccinia striiformis f. sp. tritici]
MSSQIPSEPLIIMYTILPPRSFSLFLSFLPTYIYILLYNYHFFLTFFFGSPFFFLSVLIFSLLESLIGNLHDFFESVSLDRNNLSYELTGRCLKGLFAVFFSTLGSSVYTGGVNLILMSFACLYCNAFFRDLQYPFSLS